MTRNEAKAALLSAYPHSSIGITVTETFSARAGDVSWLEYLICVNGGQIFKAGTLHGAVEQAVAARRSEQPLESEVDGHFAAESTP